MEKRLIAVFICIILIAGCKFDLTNPESDDTEDVQVVGAIWDPYINIHVFNIDVQKQHLEKLIRVGALRGVRMGNLCNPDGQKLAAWLQSQGVDVVGIFDNEHLRNPEVRRIFNRHMVQNPGVEVWEVGNEVQGFAGMSSEEYMSIATPLFHFAQQHHPYIKLAIGAVAGNGSSADDLRRMIDAGLDKLCRDGLEIVPIHFYSWQSMRLAEFQSQISRLPISTRIWVTETNNLPPSWNKQIGYMTDMYPKLRSALRAERIYFYCFSESSEFALVRGLADGGQPVYSPLMNILTGEGVVDDTGAVLEELGIPPEVLPEIPVDLKNNRDKQHAPRERERRLR